MVVKVGHSQSIICFQKCGTVTVSLERCRMMRVRFTSEAVRTVPTTVAELLTEVSTPHT